MLMIRAKKLCSTKENYNKERNHLQKALMLNGYSRQTIRSVDKTVAHEKTTSGNITENKIGTLKIPLIPRVTNKIQRIMKKHNIRTVTTTNNTLCKQLVKTKPEANETERKNVVYRIKCMDCESSYIGGDKTPIKTENIRTQNSNEMNEN